MSVLFVGGGLAAGAVGWGTAAAVAYGGVAGLGLGYLADSAGGDAPSSQSGSQKYNFESLYEKLDAQSNPALAGQMFARESNQDYGRPAYARLEAELMEQHIQGTQHQVDEHGYITRMKYGQAPEGGKIINSKKEQYEHYVDSNPEVLEGFLASGSNDKAQYGFESYRDTGQKEGKELHQIGSVIDAEGNAVKGEEVREFIGEEYAGKKINTGGAASTIGGNQQRDFYDEDGNKITRRAGFDEEGNFQGTAQLATDIAFDTQQQIVQQDMGLMEEHGQRYTEAYRDQGDIRGALNKVKKLDEESANEGISRSVTDFGSSSLRSGMLSEAIMGINAGGSLTGRESRAAKQDARAAMQARGRVNDFAGIMAEMEQNEKYRKERRQERYNFAGQVMNSEQGLMDRQTARDQLYQQGLSQDRSYAAQRVGLEQATSADPLKATTGKDSGAGLAAGTNIYGGAAGAKDAGSNTYNPHTGMAFDQQSAANADTHAATIYGADKEEAAAKINAVSNVVASAVGG